MDLTARKAAARHVIEGQQRLGAYRYPDASCLSLVLAAVEATCGEPVLPPGWVGADEERAIRAAVRRHGRLSTAYAAGVAAYGWKAHTGALWPLDVVFFCDPGQRLGEVPAIIGPEYQAWCWRDGRFREALSWPQALAVRYEGEG